MIIELPEPHINQQRIIDSTSRFRVVMCGRRFGKSELSQIEIITRALTGQRVAYITPNYSLAIKFFDKLIERLPFKNNKNELKISFPNNGSIEFFTGERLDNLRGQKFHFIVIDEASFIPNLEQGWLYSIRPTLSDYKGGALFLSTPRGKNYFYNLYLQGISDNDEWKSFKFSTYDNPHIDKSEIDDAKKQMPQVAFEQEYMANPSENASNPFGINYIKQCIYPLSDEAPVCFGIDIAKSYDYSVIIGLDKSGSVCYLDRFQKDWRTTKQTIIKLKELKILEGHPFPPILIDSTGVGDPIFEDLQREGLNITGFKFSSTSKQQLMEGLASAIHQRKITFPEGVIVNELEIFEYQYTSTGVKYSAPQGFHDDAVISLALAWKQYFSFNGISRYSFA